MGESAVLTGPPPPPPPPCLPATRDGGGQRRTRSSRLCGAPNSVGLQDEPALKSWKVDALPCGEAQYARVRACRITQLELRQKVSPPTDLSGSGQACTAGRGWVGALYRAQVQLEGAAWRGSWAAGGGHLLMRTLRGREKVDLIGEDEERQVADGYMLAELVQHLLRLREPCAVGTVNDEDESATPSHMREPVAAKSALPAEIPHGKVDATMPNGVDDEADRRRCWACCCCGVSTCGCFRGGRASGGLQRASERCLATAIQAGDGDLQFCTEQRRYQRLQSWRRVARHDLAHQVCLRL